MDANLKHSLWLRGYSTRSIRVHWRSLAVDLNSYRASFGLRDFGFRIPFSSSTSRRGLRQRRRMHRPTAPLPQQYRQQRQRPSRIHHVVHQQYRARRRRILDGKCAEKITHLLGAVLHFLLWAEVTSAAEDWLEGQIQLLRQAAAKAVDKFRPARRGHGGD